MLNKISRSARSAATVVAVASLFAGGLAAQEGRGSQQVNYHLMQLTVETEKVSLEEFTDRTREIRSCADARTLAKELEADVKRDRFVMPHHIPESLHAELSDLPTGQATKVFSTDPTLMRVIVICHRV